MADATASAETAPWWEALRLGPQDAVGTTLYVCRERQQWISTGVYIYENRMRRQAGIFRHHNNLVEQLNYPTEPSQHDVARTLAQTTLARQCDTDPETGLSKMETGLLYLASYFENQGIECRVVRGSGVYLAFLRYEITDVLGDIDVECILRELRDLHKRLHEPARTIETSGPEPRAYR